jgi:hypothetical protein
MDRAMTYFQEICSQYIKIISGPISLDYWSPEVADSNPATDIPGTLCSVLVQILRFHGITRQNTSNINQNIVTCWVSLVA